MAKSKTGRRNAGANVAAAGAQTVSVDAPAAPKPRVSPMQFLNQVRAEARKISWPSRKETWITSVMVLIMVLLAATFFWIVDWLLGVAFQFIIALGS
ncbi:MAG TPA: preprotein translocase subunit SecE [Brevundimonas sp.]|uniref:preprotein translocase subunit SecE n=1 Tax=Brevundimonas sp. TaxID=1871086 RepID=UPI002BA7D6DA|nr:preprotein translocase subunit SecE [Brevundimonas sp.]HRO32947.1 preprotein translocase subunit SecE [Brevundimonas sp.]